MTPPLPPPDVERWLEALAVCLLGLCVAFSLAALLGGCSAPRCDVPLDVTLARHPDGKPKPAALILARCAVPVQSWQWVCADARADSTGIWCDGRRKVELRP